MNSDPQTILTNILDSIDYEGDRQKYVQQFLQLAQKAAFVQLLSVLPEEKQKEFQNELQKNNNQEMIKKFISENVDPDEYKKTLQDASEMMFYKFLEEILPTLSEEQHQKLTHQLEALAPQSV